MAHTIGQWIEHIIDKDDYIQTLVNQYTKNYDPSIKLSNVIDLLDDDDKNELRNKIDNYIQNGIKDKDPIVFANVEKVSKVDVSEQDPMLQEGGQNIFVSFLKVLVSMGYKDIELDDEKCPNDYIFYYKTNAIMTRTVRDVFFRFKSLKYFFDKGIITMDENSVKLCFGVGCDGFLDYGFIQNKDYCRIGKFKLTDSVIKWLCFDLDVKSAHSIKNILLKQSYKKLILIGKIKTDLNKFDSGYNPSKMKFDITDDTVSYKLYGIGKWINNNQLDDMEYYDFKNKFNDYVCSTKWLDNVMINVSANNRWISFNVKIK